MKVKKESDLEFYIDLSNIIITFESYPYPLLAYLPRDKDKFESFSFWNAVNKINHLKNKLKDVVINQQLLSLQANPKSGDIVEMECDSDSNNVIRFLRFKETWYVSDIKEEPA